MLPSRNPSSLCMLLCLIAIISGCASRNVDWDYNPAHSLAGLKTYAWFEGGKHSRDNKEGYNSEALVQNRIQDAVNANLQARGYQLVKLPQGENPAGHVDFLVHDSTQVTQRQEEYRTTNSFGYNYYYYPWNAGISTETRIRQYDEGTLILDIIDPRTMALVWRGRSWARLERKSTPQERTEQIDTSVRLILSGFPHPPMDK